MSPMDDTGHLQQALLKRPASPGWPHGREFMLEQMNVHSSEGAGVMEPHI
jgi:hypothetical protein